MTGQQRDIVLVTGGSGLVGRAIKDHLETNGGMYKSFEFVFLSSQDVDLTNHEQTGAIFRLHKPQCVIHLAARVGGLFANMRDNDSFYSLNMSINQNVLDWASRIGVKKCISCLSTCIFPDEIEYPLDETKVHMGPPHSSNAGYSMAKRQVDLLNRKLNELHPSSLFTAVIPTNIYGRYDNFSPSQSHVVPGLIHRAYISASTARSECRNEAKLKVCGSGKPRRQFIYAPDLAKLILWVLSDYSDGNPIILCPDESDEISIGEVAELVSNLISAKLDLNISVEYDTTRSDGQYKKTASNRKLRSLYSNFRFTPFRDGLEEVIGWFCENYPDVRK